MKPTQVSKLHFVLWRAGPTRNVIACPTDFETDRHPLEPQPESATCDCGSAPESGDQQLPRVKALECSSPEADLRSHDAPPRENWPVGETDATISRSQPANILGAFAKAAG
jgi:hypothetical protein